MAYVGATVEIPFGQGGLTGTRNLSMVRAEQLIEANNITYDGGTIQKEPGAARYTPTPISGAPTILGGWDWWPTDGVQRQIVLCSDGTLRKDSGDATFPTTLASGLTVSGGVMPVFVEAGKEAAALDRKLFVFTGRNPAQVLSTDGATTHAIATPPSDWALTNQPVTGAAHEGRVWGAGNFNDPHRWYYSTPDDHENFTGATAGTVPVFPGEFDRIIAGASFKGILVTWKRPRGVYYIDTASPDRDEWKPVRLSSSISLASPMAWCVVDDDLLFMDTQGALHLISAVTEFGNLGTRNLSQLWDLDQYARDHFNIGTTGFAGVQAIFYPAKREAHFAVPGLASAVNNRRLVLYQKAADQVLPRVSDRDVCPSIWLRRDAAGIQRPVVGDTTGTVWLLDQSGRAKGGVGYTAQAATGLLDFSHADPGLASRRKNGQFLEVFYEPRGNWPILVDVYWDGRRVQTIAVNMGPAGSAKLGSTFKLGHAKLGSPRGIRSVRKRLVGSGFRLQLILRNTVVGQDFSIARIRVQCGLGDERSAA